jgi:DNA ligase D-like protein (predicted 3'-phosphoesterase)
MADKLKTYRRKRDFSRTPEPKGGRGSDGPPMFVIQKHGARALHYDLRLEIGGVLVSWAVPKGPSTDPRVKRLAVRTEDHPMDYADFEGVIPEGEYGGGAMIVWDTGNYANAGELDLPAAVKKGHLKIALNGEKIKGGYSLLRTGAPSRASGRGGDKEHWLLVKMRDEYADARRNPVNSQPESVKSGRTLEQLARGKK